MDNSNQKNWFMRHKVATGFIVLFMIALGSSALDDAKKKANENTITGNTQTTTVTPDVQETKPVEPTIKVTAIDLYNEFENNSVAAEAKYKGKRIEVTGTINSIENGLSRPYISLQSNNPYISSVYCYFDKSDASMVVSLQKNQKVTLSGSVSDSIIGIEMEQCQVVQ